MDHEDPKSLYMAIIPIMDIEKECPGLVAGFEKKIEIYVDGADTLFQVSKAIHYCEHYFEHYFEQYGCLQLDEFLDALGNMTTDFDVHDYFSNRDVRRVLPHHGWLHTNFFAPKVEDINGDCHYRAKITLPATDWRSQPKERRGIKNECFNCSFQR